MAKQKTKPGKPKKKKKIQNIKVSFDGTADELLGIIAPPIKPVKKDTQ